MYKGQCGYFWKTNENHTFGFGISVIHSSHDLQSYLYITTNFPPLLRKEHMEKLKITARQLTFPYYHLTFPGLSLLLVLFCNIQPSSSSKVKNVMSSVL